MYKNLTTKSNNLQNINHQLQNKIDQLLQNKTSNELLKQQNQSLLHKLQNLENIESKYLQLEIEKLQLETKYNDLFKDWIQLLPHQMNIKITRTPMTPFIPVK